MESRPVGRPRIEINWDEFDKLCELHCTLTEIAGFFDCSEDTIERRVKETHDINFAEYFRQKSSGGKISLRRKQYATAMAGDKTMLIWLGRNWLKQTEDKNVAEVTKDGEKLVINFTKTEEKADK